MRIKNRLSPYPILDNYGDDYVDSSFTVDYDVMSQFTEVYGELKFNLQNEDIEKLIANGLAEFVAHIECPSTCYRTVVSSSENEMQFRMDCNVLSKVIEIRTFIVLKKDVDNYHSIKFNPDYDGETFNLKAHQIIAIGTAKNFDIEKDDKDLDSLPSIISIVKVTDKKKGAISVNTDGDYKIIVGLDEEIFGLYARLGKTTFKTTCFSVVLLPALLIIIQRMHEFRNDEEFSSRHWFKVINKILEDNKVYLDDITVVDDSLLNKCQLIFGNPILRCFKELEEVSERL